MTWTGDAYNPDEDVEIMREERRHGMNPEDALNEIQQQKDEMMRAAQLMEERVSILKKLSACFLQGYQWRFDYSIDETKRRVKGVRIVCAHSGAWTELHSVVRGFGYIAGNYVAAPGIIHITFNGIDYTLDEFLNNDKKGEEE